MTDIVNRSFSFGLEIRFGSLSESGNAVEVGCVGSRLGRIWVIGTSRLCISF